MGDAVRDGVAIEGLKEIGTDGYLALRLFAAGVCRSSKVRLVDTAAAREVIGSNAVGSLSEMDKN